MNKKIYKKDVINMFNKYYNKNNNNINDTLIDMKKDKIIPDFFMKYYTQYTDFLNEFNITKSSYIKAECPLWIDQDIIRTAVVYEEDSINMFNKYYNKNNKNIKDTLINMEKDRIIPYFFMKYYGSYFEFLAKFEIPLNIYNELECPLWIDQNIKIQKKFIDVSKCTRPLRPIDKN